jgi:hypothetical protein
MTEYKKTVIVDSMTNDEIMELLRDDFVFLQHKIDENLKKYKQMVKSSVKKERVYYKPLNYKSAKGFHYMLQFFKRADDEPDKDKLGMIYYVWFVKSRGTYAVTLSRLSLYGHAEWHYTIYTPHFLDRYRERFLKDMSISKSDVIYRFIRGNLKMSSTGHPSEKYPNGIWVACSDGLCLCNHLNNINQEAKTFITYEMAGVDQKDFAFNAHQVLLKRGFDLKLPDEDFEEYTKEDFEE